MRFSIEFKGFLFHVYCYTKASPSQPQKEKSHWSFKFVWIFNKAPLEDIFTLIKNEFSLNLRSIKSSFIITYFPLQNKKIKEIITVQINFHHLHGSCVGVKSLCMCVGVCVFVCKSSSHFPYYSNFIMLIIKKFHFFLYYFILLHFLANIFLELFLFFFSKKWFYLFVDNTLGKWMDFGSFDSINWFEFLNFTKILDFFLLFCFKLLRMW